MTSEWTAINRPTTPEPGLDAGAVLPERELAPCPLCQSTDLHVGSCYQGESTEREAAVRCARCGCRSTLLAWINRTSQRREDVEPVAWQFRQRSGVGPGPQAQAPWGDWCSIDRGTYDHYISQPNKLIEVRPLYAIPPSPPAMKAVEDWIEAQDVETDFERGVAAGIARREALANEVLERTMTAEVENESLRTQLASARKALEECRTSYCGYAITSDDQYQKIMKDFWAEIQRIDKIAEAALTPAPASTYPLTTEPTDTMRDSAEGHFGNAGGYQRRTED
jgi:hypothetical protein